MSEDFKYCCSTEFLKQWSLIEDITTHAVLQLNWARVEGQKVCISCFPIWHTDYTSFFTETKKSTPTDRFGRYWVMETGVKQYVWVGE